MKKLLLFIPIAIASCQSPETIEDKLFNDRMTDLENGILLMNLQASVDSITEKCANDPCYTLTDRDRNNIFKLDSIIAY